MLNAGIWGQRLTPEARAALCLAVVPRFDAGRPDYSRFLVIGGGPLLLYLSIGAPGRWSSVTRAHCVVRTLPDPSPNAVKLRPAHIKSD